MAEKTPAAKKFKESAGICLDTLPFLRYYISSCLLNIRLSFKPIFMHLR